MATKTTDWNSSVQGYKDYLVLERGLSKNSVLAYMRDIHQFRDFATTEENVQRPTDIELPHVERFLGHLYDKGLARNSQARMLSGVRSFCKYLRIEGVMDSDPIQLIQAPKPERKLPDVLSVEEIESIIGAVNMSRREGVRNKAMLEVLYSCGLRVSELIELKMSRVDLIDGVVKVVGKGNKERVIPIGQQACEEGNSSEVLCRSSSAGHAVTGSFSGASSGIAGTITSGPPLEPICIAQPDSVPDAGCGPPSVSNQAVSRWIHKRFSGGRYGCDHR